VLRKLEAVFGRNMKGILAGQPQQQLGLGDILALRALSQMALQLNIVTLAQALQYLSGEVAVPIVNLMKILHTMGGRAA